VSKGREVQPHVWESALGTSYVTMCVFGRKLDVEQH
jgi:hypothetical protein